jgi:hypothetical protein
LASGARDTAESATSSCARWTTKPSKPSAIARTTDIPPRSRAEHEVVDEQLRAPSEKIRQRAVASLGVEALILVDPDSRQRLTPPCYLKDTSSQQPQMNADEHRWNNHHIPGSASIGGTQLFLRQLAVMMILTFGSGSIRRAPW